MLKEGVSVPYREGPLFIQLRRLSELAPKIDCIGSEDYVRVCSEYVVCCCFGNK